MVDIIIPTKGKLDCLFECLKGIREHTNAKYHVHIADTGSSEDELEEMIRYLKLHFSKSENASLYMYDYYNFAKINNDVVKNTNGEWLLFCKHLVLRSYKAQN